MTQAPTRLSLKDFARIHASRRGRMMWLIGAGASVGAGVPSADHLTWQFKRAAYAAEAQVPIGAVDIADPVVRQRIQRFLDEQQRFPASGTNEEYSTYFEFVHPTVQDRRRYLDDLIARARHGYAQLATAGSMPRHVA